MAYNWVPVSPLSKLLPWFAVLLLFLLPRNRVLTAWWLWLPLICGLLLQPGLRMILASIPSEPLDMFGQAVTALFFALATFWLISGYLGQKHRFVALLGSLAVVGGFGELAVVCSLIEEGMGPELLVSAIFVALGAFIISVSLSFAGLLCRHRYQWWRLSLWLVVCLTVVSSVTMAPFVLFAFIASHGGMGVGELLTGVLLLAGICFATLLPFLVLSFANSFYRERLKAFLHLTAPLLPPSGPPEVAKDAAAALGAHDR